MTVSSNLPSYNNPQLLSSVFSSYIMLSSQKEKPSPKSSSEHGNEKVLSTLRKNLCKLINCDKKVSWEWHEKFAAPIFYSIQWILYFVKVLFENQPSLSGYMISSSPRTLPQFLSGIVHFLAISCVARYRAFRSAVSLGNTLLCLFRRR